MRGLEEVVEQSIDDNQVSRLRSRKELINYLINFRQVNDIIWSNAVCYLILIV